MAQEISRGVKNVLAQAANLGCKTPMESYVDDLEKAYFSERMIFGEAKLCLWTFRISLYSFEYVCALTF